MDILFERCIGSGSGGSDAGGTGGGRYSVDDADREREHYYNIATEVDGRLNRIDDEVGDLEKMFEGLVHGGGGAGVSGSMVGGGSSGLSGGLVVGGGGGAGADGDDVAEIVNVINRQNQILSGLEVRCEKMESEMNLVSRVVLDR